MGDSVTPEILSNMIRQYFSQETTRRRGHTGPESSAQGAS